MIRKAVVASLFLSTSALAQIPAGNSAPQPVPIVDTIPAAQDVPYPGTITLNVDATDTERGIFTVHETIPVSKTGDVALLYPKWLPGNHAYVTAPGIGKIASHPFSIGARGQRERG